MHNRISKLCSWFLWAKGILLIIKGLMEAYIAIKAYCVTSIAETMQYIRNMLIPMPDIEFYLLFGFKQIVMIVEAIVVGVILVLFGNKVQKNAILFVTGIIHIMMMITNTYCSIWYSIGDSYSIISYIFSLTVPIIAYYYKHIQKMAGNARKIVDLETCE